MSKSDERSTPDILFNELHKEFNFEIDLFASNDLHKLDSYFTKETNAFKYPWILRSFSNPPYSKLYKCLEYNDKQREHEDYKITVWILPCDTSTAWFHDFIWDKDKNEFRNGVKVRFPQGRYKFGKYKTSPQFATIIAIFYKK